LVHNIVQARTEVVSNSTLNSLAACTGVIAYFLVDLNPKWDQIIYTPVHSLKETLLLEVMDYQNLTKDRSLGTVEIKVSELAQEKKKDVDDPRFPFESMGKKDKSEPIRLDRGNQYKGQLHFLAEFLPAFALQGLKFDTGPNEIQSAIEAVEDDDDGDSTSSSSSSSEGEGSTRAVTTTKPIGPPKSSAKNAQSKDTQAAASTNATEARKSTSTREGSPSSGEIHSVDGKDGAKRKSEGIRMSKDELLVHRRW
jgi:hypothetical protein